MSNLKERAFTALNLEQYGKLNLPDYIGKVALEIPKERQYILRMLVKKPFGEYKIPKELKWLVPLIVEAKNHQKRMGIKQPFVYITVRNGLVTSTEDDVWHVDGFSKTITHLPEQNYIWTDKYPTEYVQKRFFFPSDFNPMIHNIHSYLQNFVLPENIKVCNKECLYAFDPYITHRRPSIPENIERCFVRISFTPIEIEDVNNTINPLLKTKYKRDGKKDFRDKLIDYPIKSS